VDIVKKYSGLYHMKKHITLFKMTSLLLVLLVGSLNVVSVAATFTAQRIQFRGLERIGRDTVETYLPVKVGTHITPKKTEDILRALYKTGFFRDVRLTRQGQTLIIIVSERPVIGHINIKGNSLIPKKPFDDLIKSTGLQKGHIFNRSVLEQVRLALLNQYKTQSHYNARVYTEVKPLSRNRVAVKVRIKEGHATKIRSIHIIGNHAFSQSKLIRVMNLSTTHFWSWVTRGDHYSEVDQDKALNALHDFYLNKGYLAFKIVLRDVHFTTDKRHVDITIHMSEGPVYYFSDVYLVGDMKGYKSALQKQLTVKPGQRFSRSAILKTQKNIISYLAEKGYAFSDVRIKPHTDSRSGRVSITFNIRPGHYVYVRQINFKGNKKTEDQVLRHQLRQREGSLLSMSKLRESKRRLANLGYLDKIQIKMKPIPDKPNQVDVDYSVEETSSAKASLQLAWSDKEGLIYGASLNQANFMGTGKTVNLSFDRSDYRRTFSFYYNNPYCNRFDVSCGFNVYVERTTPGRTNISSYRTNTYGASLHYGIPFTSHSRLSASLGYEHIELNANNNASLEVKDFVERNGGVLGVEPAKFDQFKLIGSWAYSTYDRLIFPTKGLKNIVVAEVGLPIGGRPLDYYLISYHAAWYHPFFREFVFTTHLNLGYGRGYGETGSRLPLFKHYYAGGINSVRGYEANTLGPLDSRGHALGGNVLTAGGVGIILPPYLGSKLRTTLFLDAGMVFQDKLNDLRYSAGLMIEWLSPHGSSLGT